MSDKPKKPPGVFKLMDDFESTVPLCIPKYEDEDYEAVTGVEYAGEAMRATAGDEDDDEEDEEAVEKPFVIAPDFRPLFPLPTPPRAAQEQILDQATEWLQSPEVDHVIIEGPVGIGKSGIAIALARMVKSAWVITVNKYLQDQYARDFDSFLANLKGRENYECSREPLPGQPRFNCKNSPCQETPSSKKACGRAQACEFHAYKKAAIASPITLFNFAAGLSFLNYVGGFKDQKRSLLVIDEVHNTVDQATGFAEIVFDRDELNNMGIGGNIPDYNDVEMYLSWVKEVREKAAKVIDTPGMDRKIRDSIESLQRKLRIFAGFPPHIFVLDKEYEKRMNYLKKLRFTPADVSTVLQRYLFKSGQKTVMLSATILNKDAFIESLGIKPHRTRFITVDSPFPKENRPIFTHRVVGNFNQQNMEGYMPAIVASIDDILGHYKDVKGIIHGHTYKICEYIAQHSKASARLIYPKTAREQTEALGRHFSSPEPTILLSPSMKEGVDLKDDACRIQIIVKTPYPYLGDPVVKKRMELYPNYYRLKTALALVQSYGRAVRSETDHAATFLLDGNTVKFIKMNQDLFPKWFLKAMV